MFFQARKTRVRLRASEAVFLLMTVLSLLAAWNTGNQLLYIVFAGLLAFLAVSHAWTSLFSLRGLSMARQAPYAVHRGQPFTVRVRVENHRRFMPAFALRLAHANGRGDTAGFVRSLPALRAANVNVREVFEKRGVYAIPPYGLVCGYPFGLANAVRHFDDGVEVLVYPRVQAVRAAAIEQFRSGARAPRAATGDGDEFFNLREYVVGDDLRRIAWKVSARMGKWIVREMTRERSRHVVFVLDTRHKAHVAGFEARFEDAIEMVASLAVSLLRRHYSVALITPGRVLDNGEGVPHERRLLDALARIEELPAETPFDPGPAIRGLDIPWATVIEVSPDPEAWGTAFAGGRRVLDPREVVYA